MQFSLAILTTLFLGTATAAALPAAPEGQAAAAKTLVKVNLPAPDNWLTGSRLFPANIIASYNAELKDYATADAWNAFVLDKCQSFTACTSTASYQGRFFFFFFFFFCHSVVYWPSKNHHEHDTLTNCESRCTAINSGSTGGRYWFGEVYRGGATTPADYERVPDAAFGVTNSQMYTIQA